MTNKRVLGILIILSLVVSAGISMSFKADREPKVDHFKYPKVMVALTSSTQLKPDKKKIKEFNESTNNLYVIEVDGCEYLISEVMKQDVSPQIGIGLSRGLMAHKGNCKNPVHCHNK